MKKVFSSLGRYASTLDLSGHRFIGPCKYTTSPMIQEQFHNCKIRQKTQGCSFQNKCLYQGNLLSIYDRLVVDSYNNTLIR